MFSPSAHGGHEPVPLVGKYSRIGKRCRKSRRLNQSATIEPDKLSLDAIGRASPSERLPYLSLPYHESMEKHSPYIIEQAIEEADGNQTNAADRLKLQRTYLACLIKQQKVKKEPE
jgi:DNA-binding NtrC family response regulator